MKRYETHIDDGTVYLESDDGLIEIGKLDTITDVIGGETYTVTYDEQQRTQAWLETDEDGRMTFDVRETITDLSFQHDFVDEMRATDQSTEKYGLPERTVEFAEAIVSIFEQQGVASQTE